MIMSGHTYSMGGYVRQIQESESILTDIVTQAWGSATPTHTSCVGCYLDADGLAAHGLTLAANGYCEMCRLLLDSISKFGDETSRRLLAGPHAYRRRTSFEATMITSGATILFCLLGALVVIFAGGIL